MMRINKYLAHCGVASRREADSIVVSGRVTVNGQIVNIPGTQIDESTALVTVDGRPVGLIEKYAYIVLNKPAGCLTSHADPHHGNTVMQYVQDAQPGLNPVGRLDYDTEGVLILSNDGELIHRLTHPRYGAVRVYQAVVKGRISPNGLRSLSRGLPLPDGTVGRAEAKIITAGDSQSEVHLELTEGRKREVKHLCRAIGHPVLQLRRIAYAGITLEGLPPGRWRHLTKTEVAGLRKLVGLET